MERMDTINLLKECDAGTKMALESIDEMLQYADDENLRHALDESRTRHEKIEGQIHCRLNMEKAQEKDPPMMAKGMSWLKTNWKMSMDESDATVADLVTDGCNMGIKQLRRYKNQYENADREAMEICDELIAAEHQLCKNMRAFL